MKITDVKPWVVETDHTLRRRPTKAHCTHICLVATLSTWSSPLSISTYSRLMPGALGSHSRHDNEHLCIIYT